MMDGWDTEVIVLDLTPEAQNARQQVYLKKRARRRDLILMAIGATILGSGILLLVAFR